MQVSTCLDIENITGGYWKVEIEEDNRHFIVVVFLHFIILEGRANNEDINRNFSGSSMDSFLCRSITCYWHEIEH